MFVTGGKQSRAAVLGRHDAEALFSQIIV